LARIESDRLFPVSGVHHLSFLFRGALLLVRFSVFLLSAPPHAPSQTVWCIIAPPTLCAIFYPPPSHLQFFPLFFCVFCFQLRCRTLPCGGFWGVMGWLTMPTYIRFRREGLLPLLFSDNAPLQTQRRRLAPLLHSALSTRWSFFLPFPEELLSPSAKIFRPHIVPCVFWIRAEVPAFL